MAPIFSVKRFVDDEAGAVAVDWVMLTAAVVGLGLLTSSSSLFDLRGSLTNASTGIATNVAKAATSAAVP